MLRHKKVPITGFMEDKYTLTLDSRVANIFLCVETMKLICEAFSCTSTPIPTDPPLGAELLGFFHVARETPFKKLSL